MEWGDSGRGAEFQEEELHVQRHEGQIEFIQLFTDSHCMPCLAQEDIARTLPSRPSQFSDKRFR